MIEWLENNSLWLSAVGAIAAIVAVIVAFLKTNKASTTAEAKNGSVANTGEINNSEINVSQAQQNLHNDEK